MGCGVQIHENAGKRKTWAPHSVDGYYLGTSPDHCRAHRIYVKGTNAERISETVFFKHKYLTNSTVSHADRVVQAAKELYNALNRKKAWHGKGYYGRFEGAQQYVSQDGKAIQHNKLGRGSM